MPPLSQHVLTAAPDNLKAARLVLCTAPRAESMHSSVMVTRNTSVERWYVLLLPRSVPPMHDLSVVLHSQHHRAWMASSMTQSPSMSDIEDDEVHEWASVLSFEEEDVIDARLVQLLGTRETVSVAVNVFYHKYAVRV